MFASRLRAAKRETPRLTSEDAAHVIGALNARIKCGAGQFRAVAVQHNVNPAQIDQKVVA